MGKKAVFLAFLVCAAAETAEAHHSFAMFDQEKVVTLVGVVKELELVNPHSWIHVTAPNAQGRPVVWSLEMNGIAAMQRQGWNKESVREGDPITIQMHPLKSGARGGQFLTATMKDGRVFEDGAGINIQRGGAR